MEVMNILLVSATPVRADRLSCYGHSRDTSPNVDRFAAEGILFERACSQAGWTPPSHASLLTGLYPSNHGVFTDGTQLRTLPTSVPTLPELLSGMGYHTAGFLNSGLLGSRTGLDRGFEEFCEVWRLEGGRNAAGGMEETSGALKKLADSVPRLKRLAKRLVQRSGLVDLGAQSKAWFTRAEVTTRRVIDWLEASGRREKPFFLFLHYGDPHYKCHAPFPHTFRYVSRFRPGVDWAKVDLINENPFLFMTGQVEATPEDFEVLKALYDAEVHYLDRGLGRLFAHLRRSGLLDRTLVIFLSHHGSSLGEHGLGSQVACLYEPVVHVPLIVRCPGMAPARSPALVELTDVLPTVLELAGRGTGGLRLDGRCMPPFGDGGDGAPRDLAAAEWKGDDTWYFLHSHVPELVREALDDPDRRSAMERFARSLQMVREGDFKYIAGSDGREELYDVALDPGELRDLSALEPERARALAARLRSHLGPAVPDGPKDEARERVLRGLRDVGYRI